jgi:hypothetical protein
MLANAMIYSIPRYWMQSSFPPDHIIQGLEADVYHLLWAKDHEFDVQAIGSTTKNRPYIKHTTIYNTRKWHQNTGLGVGLLDLESHARALRVNWILKYLDASEGRWKLILDAWLVRSRHGRGHILLSIPVDRLIGSLAKGSPHDSCLPEFWKAALLDLRELELKRRQTSPLGAEAQPLWNNTIGDVQPDPKFWRVWQTLRTHTVAHLTNDDYERYTREENGQALEQYKCDTIEGTILIKGERFVRSEVSDSFEDLCDSVPREWLLPMSREHLDRPCEGAWWGQCEALALLQKPSSEDINMLAASNTLDEILRGTKGKKKRKPLKAYYYDLEGEIKYISYKEDNETYYDTVRDPQGRLHKQEETQIMGTLIPTAQWGDGHTHVQFPRPKEYTLGDIGSPLDRISVKQLTLEFTKNKRTAPTAPKEWNKRMISIKQAPPDWTIVADRYAARFLTHKDAATPFKHITHRAIFTRNRNSKFNKKDRLCRLCHKAKEDSLHMGQCQVIQTLFSRINRLNATTIQICSALRRGDQTNNAVMEILFLAPRADVPLAIGSLLTILWKYTLMHWYKVDIEKFFLSRTPYGAKPSED